MTDMTEHLRIEVQIARNDVFVWGVSTWSGYRYGGAADTAGVGTEWLDIIGPSKEIAIRRGMKKDGIDLTIEAGTMEAFVRDSRVDPNTNPYIKPGTPFRLVWDALGYDVAVFTGTIENVQVTYERRKPQVRIRAVDRVKTIANISRSGTIAGTYKERVQTLLGKHGIPHSVYGSSTTVIANNAYDSTLLNHITLASTSERGVAFVDRENVVRAYGSIVDDVGLNKGNIIAPDFTYFNEPSVNGVEAGWEPFNTGVISGTISYQNLFFQEIYLTGGSMASGSTIGIRKSLRVSPNTPYSFAGEATQYMPTNLITKMRIEIIDYDGNVLESVEGLSARNVSITVNGHTSAYYARMSFFVEATASYSGTFVASVFFAFIEVGFVSRYGIRRYYKPNACFADYSLNGESLINLPLDPGCEYGNPRFVEIGTSLTIDPWNSSGNSSISVTQNATGNSGFRVVNGASVVVPPQSKVTFGATVFSQVACRVTFAATPTHIARVFDVPANEPVQIGGTYETNNINTIASPASFDVYIANADGSRWTTGSVALFDEFRIVYSDSYNFTDPYFDGDSDSAYWEGASYGSRSIRDIDYFKSYVDIGVGYNSASVINDVYINDKTRGIDDNMQPISVETKWGPYRNVTSIATYGPYTEEVDTNIGNAISIEDFANSILDSNDSPRLSIDSVRLNMTDNTEIAANMEVFDTVKVEYSTDDFNIDQNLSVLNITHRITASSTEHRWMTDLEITKMEDDN